MKVETGVSPALRVRVTKADHNTWYRVGDVYEVKNEVVSDPLHKDFYPLTTSLTVGIGVEDFEIIEDIDVVPKPNKYSREIKPGVFVDVYDVLRAFNVTDPSLQHLLKKALAAGCRGHKDVEEDLNDILASAKRAVEMYNEWKKE